MSSRDNSTAFQAAIDQAIVRAVQWRADHPSHDQKWAGFTAQEALITRQALKVADSLRGSSVDPADAYLRGIADYHAAQTKLQTSSKPTNLPK